MKAGPLIVVLLAWSLCAPGREALLPRRDSLTVGRLDNGLTYYICPHAQPAGEAVYRLFVKAGSLQEREDQQGLAHFLEHLAFNGTEHFPADAMVRFLEHHGARFGSDLNAHTSFNETVYKFQLPSADPALVDSTITILSDIAAGQSIAPEEVEKERGVILSEWRQRSGSKKKNEAFLDETLEGSRFADRPTIGDTAVIRHATPGVIRDYYRTWYRPSLMAVAVVGDVDPVLVEGLVRARFSALEDRTEPEAVTYRIPAYRENRVKVVYDADSPSATLDILQRTQPRPGVDTREAYRTYLVQAVLGRLAKQRFADLSFTEPAYRSASLSRSNLLGAVRILDFSVELRKDRAAQGIEDALMHVRQLFDYGFTGSEIEQVSRSILASLEGRTRPGSKVTSSGLMDEIYADFFNGDRCIDPGTELALARDFLPGLDSLALLRELSAIRAEAPFHVLVHAPDSFRALLGDEAAVSAVLETAAARPVYPYGHGLDVPETLCAPGDSGTILSETTLPDGEVTDWRLGNGARVLYRRSPLDRRHVQVSGFRRGGLYALDTLDYQTGVFAGGIVPLSGAGPFSREALGWYLAGNSAKMRLLVDKTRTGVAGSADIEDVETLFQLLYLKWTGAKVDTTLARQVVRRTVDEYRTRIPDPEKEFGRELGWLSGGKDYTNEEQTDSLVLATVREDRMLETFRQMFGSAEGYTFIITADLPAEEMAGYVRRYVATLPGGAVDTRYRHLRPETAPGEVVRFSRRAARSPRATVTLLFQDGQAPAIPMQEVAIRQDALKGVLRTVLLRRLREDLGKVYSVSVSSSAGKYPSFLSRTTIAFACAPEDADDLAAATLSILADVADDPASIADILADVQAHQMKEYQKGLQGNTFFTATVRNMVFNDEEDWSLFRRYPGLVEGVTPGQVAGMVRDLLSAARIEAVLLPE